MKSKQWNNKLLSQFPKGGEKKKKLNQPKLVNLHIKL